MRIFLIHGMGRSRASMALLAAKLRNAGHATSSFGYRVTRGPLERIAHDFTRHVAQHAHSEPYAIVGHSLGNVITRLASPDLPSGFERFAMLAPPNRSPALARAARGSRLFEALTGDAGHKLGDPQFLAALPLPAVPTAIFAGHRSVRWLPFRGAPSDEIVSVEETRLAGVPHRSFDTAHTFIMNDVGVTHALLGFLESGQLEAAAEPD